MRTPARSSCLAMVFCAAVAVGWSGCSREEVTQTLKKAETSAEEAAATTAKEVGKMVKEGESAASELGEKAIAYLSPLKEQFSKLDSLKESPEELKTAVTDLIQSIEEKAEDVHLPEAISNTLATVKEKLMALKEYLEGEVDQAKIGEHIQGIMDSVTSGLGLSGN